MLDFSLTFVITIINIAILCFILKAVLFKPVTKFMADRAKRVQDTITQTDRDRVQANELLTQYQNQLKTAEVEAEAILHSAKENAELEAKKIIDDSRSVAEQTLNNAKRQIEMEQQAAIAVFRKEAAALVVAATGRLLGREIKSEDNLQYAGMLLDEVSLLNKTDSN